MLKLRKTYLHIGVEKTGTTSIQACMAKNRGALREQGYLYPVAPGQKNHIGIAILAADKPKDVKGLRKFVGLAPTADLKAYSARMVAALEKEAAESGCHTLVLSNEHLSSRVRTAESIALLRDTLLTITESVDIIVYIRRQDEALLSEYSTLVKVASYTKPFNLRPQGMRKYNYAELLDRWCNAFRREHLSIRLFEHRSLLHGDVIADFRSAIHYPESAPLENIPPQNRSLDVSCLEYLRRINKHLPMPGEGQGGSERADIIKHLSKMPQGEAPRISGEQSAEILKYFQESNKDVAIRYFDRPDGQLFAPSPQHSVQTNLGELDEDSAFRISAALWRRLRRKPGIPAQPPTQRADP